MHRPRLLTDNGSSYLAGDLAEWLEGWGMPHIRVLKPDSVQQARHSGALPQTKADKPTKIPTAIPKSMIGDGEDGA